MPTWTWTIDDTIRPYEPQVASPETRRSILGSLHGTYRHAGYFDLTITCGEDQHMVHKLIVCSRSSFFANAIQFGGKESQDSVIALPEDDPVVVKLLIDYIYYGDYTPDVMTIGLRQPVLGIDKDHIERLRKNSLKWSYSFPHNCIINEGLFGSNCNVCEHHHGSCCRKTDFICSTCVPAEKIIYNQATLFGRSEIPDISRHVKMYRIGDKYDVAGLQDIAAEKFELCCACYWLDDSFVDAAREVFSTTVPGDRELENMVLDTIWNHLELVKKPLVKEFLKEFNLSWKILKRNAEEKGDCIFNHKYSKPDKRAIQDADDVSETSRFEDETNEHAIQDVQADASETIRFGSAGASLFRGNTNKRGIQDDQAGPSLFRNNTDNTTIQDVQADTSKTNLFGPPPVKRRRY